MFTFKSFLQLYIRSIQNELIVLLYPANGRSVCEK